MRRSGLLALVASLVLVAGCATATLLPNGRVLILSLVAKTYDPVAGRVVNSAQPPTMRLMATATALDNGLVLIAGGASGMATGFSLGGSDEPSGPQTYASADLYDPATDTYTATGSMAHPRTFHTATLLADGRVLIVGGGETETTVGTTGPSTPQVVPPPELYDPATGTFGPTAGDTVAPHVLATATRLQDGRVLIAGGVTADLNAGTAGASPAPSPSGAPTTKAELFDPATGTFTATGSMTTARVWHTATLLQDGRVLIVGGTANSNMDTSGAAPADPTLMTAEIYDPVSGTFSPTGGPANARFAHTASILDDGRVLVVGGIDTAAQGAGGDPFIRAAELFDPSTGTFAATGDMVEGQLFPTSTLLQSGQVLLVGLGASAMSGAAGAAGSSGDPLSSAQLYDPATGTFSPVEVEPAVLPSSSPGTGLFT